MSPDTATLVASLLLGTLSLALVLYCFWGLLVPRSRKRRRLLHNR